MSETTDLGKILARVRKLVSLAEHESTTEHEAALAREQADALMLKYSIDEAMARQAMSAEDRSKPGILLVEVGAYNSEITPWVSTMLNDLARHCRCKVRDYAEFAKVYGFEYDLRYFEILYTTIRLHMLGAFLPRIDKTQNLDENCFRLHESGRNWLEIAEIYGWKRARYSRISEYARETDKAAWNFSVPYWNKETDEVAPATRVGGIFKRAYYRECKKRGVNPTQISASSSEAYRRSAAQGYVYRLRQRLSTVEKGRDTAGSGGAEVALRTSWEEVIAFLRKDNPDLYPTVKVDDEPAPMCEKCAKSKSGYCRDHPKGRAYQAPAFSDAGWRAGARHADTADISGGRRSPGGGHRALD